ncbi:hypothetical protein [Streptomyces sp. NPDC059945]|uniref:hypothetical protein n=1 Tax=Streptomyces sp. NPDC059945 TaxID=3347012 RepID=UPI003664FDA9
MPYGPGPLLLCGPFLRSAGADAVVPSGSGHFLHPEPGQYESCVSRAALSHPVLPLLDT